MQPSAMAPRARIPDSLISHSGWNRVSWNVECSQQILIRFSEERFLYRNELIGGREREFVRTCGCLRGYQVYSAFRMRFCKMILDLHVRRPQGKTTSKRLLKGYLSILRRRSHSQYGIYLRKRRELLTFSIGSSTGRSSVRKTLAKTSSAAAEHFLRFQSERELSSSRPSSSSSSMSLLVL